jgi:hypothetical protein
MSAPVNQKKQLIKKYFNLLVEEFIKDPKHSKNISIVFQDYLKSSKKNTQTLGHTQQFINERRKSKTAWQEWSNGKKVPGSEKTTITTTYTYKYIITFLNNYKNENELRGTVVHEFTHLYLHATIDGKHGHDDRFYSAMERFENWLNQNQGLSPRVDKSHDRDQYEDNHSETINDKENTCPECSCLSPYHSPNCSHNKSNSSPINHQPNQESDDPPKEEFSRLNNLLKNSPDLATLERNYQTVKVNGLYSNKNKEVLDTSYQTQKKRLQF